VRVKLTGVWTHVDSHGISSEIWTVWDWTGSQMDSRPSPNRPPTNHCESWGWIGPLDRAVFLGKGQHAGQAADTGDPVVLVDGVADGADLNASGFRARE
jgi:hypothetical protein